jgi:hypothetical protein
MERLTQDRALQEKRRREEEEFRNRDRWAHCQDMQNARPTPTASSTRAPDVSLNMTPAPDSSNMVISTVQSIPPAAQHVEKNAQISNLAPEQMGSFVTPAASATLRSRNDELFEIAGCFRCGGNHHEVVCQQKDPWEYIAPYYGSSDFGQGFFSIPVVESDAQPVEQMNYAHIIVETGNVTCKDIEHELNVWAESMHIN